MHAAYRFGNAVTEPEGTEPRGAHAQSELHTTVAELIGLRNALALLELPMPGTGRPFSEPFLFGLGGGVRFLFAQGQLPSGPGPGIAVREETDPVRYVRRLTQRLGVRLTEVGTSGSPATGFKEQRRAFLTIAGKDFAVERGPAEMDIGQAIYLTVGECAGANLRPSSPYGGLPGLVRWAELLIDGRHPQGWPRALTEVTRLLDALIGIYAALVEDGSGMAFRAAYSAFLDEAAWFTGRVHFRTVARQYREAADMWSDVSRATLPPGIPGFARLREAIEQDPRIRPGLPGPAGQQDLRDIENVEDIRRDLAANFPLSRADVAALLMDLHLHVERLRHVEAACAISLNGLLPPA